MVTSQGQVVTQAIPQGAIQIQNTQVSVRRSVHLCMSSGRLPVIVYCLPGTVASDSLRPHLSEAAFWIGSWSRQGFTSSRVYIKRLCISCAWPAAPTTLHLNDTEFRSIESCQVRCLRSDISSVILRKSSDLSGPQFLSIKKD